MRSDDSADQDFLLSYLYILSAPHFASKILSEHVLLLPDFEMLVIWSTFFFQHLELLALIRLSFSLSLVIVFILHFYLTFCTSNRKMDHHSCKYMAFVHFV